MRSPAGPGALTSMLLVHAFWFCAFLLLPLSMSPAVLFGLGNVGLEATPEYRAYATVALLLLGLGLGHYLRRRNMEQAIPMPEPKAALRWQLPLICLVLVLALSSVFDSTTPWPRATGSSERFDGALVQAAWFGLALVASVIADRSGPNMLVVFRYVLAGAIATSIWVALQATGNDPLTLVSRAGVFLDLPAGAFGHGALASMYLVLALLVLWTAAAFGVFPKKIAVIVSFVLAVGAAGAGGRAAAVGMMVSAAVLVFRLRREPAGLRTLLHLALASIIGVAAAYVVFPRTQRQAAAAGAAMVGMDGSFNARLPAWRGGYRLMLEHPLVGVGPEGFAYGVWPHLDERDAAVLIRGALGAKVAHLELKREDYSIAGNAIAYVDSENRLAVESLRWDKAHNYYIDLALTAGIPALLLYLFTVGLMLRTLLSSVDPFAVGAGLALLSYLVYGIAWFGTVSLDPVTWLIVGCGLGWAQNPRRSAASSSHVGNTDSDPTVQGTGSCGVSQMPVVVVSPTATERA